MSANGGSTNGQNKWQNLQDGVLQGFLPGLDSGIDNVGLTTLPPDINGTNDVCQAASSNNYDSTTPTYTVVPLSNTYMDSSGNLIPSSPLVSDINCMQPGGGTDYADAMEAAYNELNLHDRPRRPKDHRAALRRRRQLRPKLRHQNRQRQAGQRHPAPLHPTLPISRQRRRHLQSPGHPDLHHPLRRPIHRPRLPRLHRRQRSPLPTALDSHAGHRQPRQLLPRPQPQQPRSRSSNKSPQTWPPAPAASSANRRSTPRPAPTRGSRHTRAYRCHRS